MDNFINQEMLKMLIRAVRRANFFAVSKLWTPEKKKKREEHIRTVKQYYFADLFHAYVPNNLIHFSHRK
jgi:diketogulonate reductase-like aldo/keto reductase